MRELVHWRLSSLGDHLSSAAGLVLGWKFAWRMPGGGKPFCISAANPNAVMWSSGLSKEPSSCSTRSGNSSAPSSPYNFFVISLNMSSQSRANGPGIATSMSAVPYLHLILQMKNNFNTKILLGLCSLYTSLGLSIYEDGLGPLTCPSPTERFRFVPLRLQPKTVG